MRTNFSYERMSTKTRFEKNAKGNSEVVYCSVKYQLCFCFCFLFFLSLRISPVSDLGRGSFYHLLVSQRYCLSFFSFQWFHLLTSWYNKIYVSERCPVLLAKLRFSYMLFIFSNCLNHSKSYKLRAFIKEKKHHG